MVNSISFEFHVFQHFSDRFENTLKLLTLYFFDTDQINLESSYDVAQIVIGGILPWLLLPYLFTSEDIYY